MNYERIISHKGLSASRVIRGFDRNIVNAKAEVQLKIWEERWQKRQSKQMATLNRAEKKRLAETTTRQAQEQLSALEKTLRDSLAKARRINWDELKQGPFQTARPQPPVLYEPLPAPKREDPMFQPRLGLIARRFSFVRSWKAASAEKRFREAESHWNREMAVIRATNETNTERFKGAARAWETAWAEFEKKRALKNAPKQSEYEDKVPAAIIEYCDMVLERSQYPDNFPRSCLLEYLSETRTMIAEYDLPPITAIPTLKEFKYVTARNAFTETHVTSAWLRRTYEDLLYQIVLRTINELLQADYVGAIETIVLNGWVTDIDRATGKNVTACILSVQVSRAEFTQIDLAHVDPRTCFKKLKGVSASALVDLAPVRPILRIKREDKRFVEAYAVVDSLDDSSNLAAMDWEDFENLIREVFEKEFSKNGGEVKITRASRDGGVDAVAFDPDPIRGGKIVIQAKRYTNVVSVSAVRDLYGTLLNEGANKGILVTTADYGPDAYEFAKGKPLTLINGNELLYLLQQHGHRSKIDLAAARKLQNEKERSGGITEKRTDY